MKHYAALFIYLLGVSIALFYVGLLTLTAAVTAWMGLGGN